MDFMTPPSFDPSNIVVWKYRMSMYLKTLGLHVLLAATKKCYLGNGDHIGANALALRLLEAHYLKNILHVFLTLIPHLQCGTC